MNKLRKTLNRQNGDTIVEVLLALTVIAMSLGISFGIANRSTNVGTESRERSQALKLAESQFEYLKNDMGNIGIYRDATPYCIVGGARVTGLGCQSINGSIFSLTVQYAPVSGANPEIFKSIVTWQQLNSEGSNQVSLVYRP